MCMKLTLADIDPHAAVEGQDVRYSWCILKIVPLQNLGKAVQLG